MLKFITFAFLLGLAVVPSTSSVSAPQPKSDLTCELCNLVLTAAQSLIAKNETDDKIIAFIEKHLCGNLGSLNGTCVQFMESEGREIIYELSNGIHPAIICKKLGLCNAKKVEFKTTATTLNCTICKLVMTQVQNMLKNNASETEILDFIEDHICNLTGKLSQLCKTVIDSYGPQILKLLANDIDPTKVCELIGMCTNSSSTLTTVKPQTHNLFCEFTTQVFLQHINGDMILHEVESLLSHGCSVFGSAGSCSVFVETFTPVGLNLISQNIDPNSVCESFNFHHLIEAPKNPLTCELCTIVLTAAQSLLAKNQTETQVLQFIEKELCARLGALNATCVNLLETEGRVIITDLINGLNVSTVCKKFNLCSSHRKVVAVEAPKNPLTCELCTIVLTAAQSLLAKNQTETQVLQFLEKELCARLGSLNATCVNLLETEGRVIINDLISGVNVSTVCKKFNLCAAHKVEFEEAPKNPLTCELCTIVFTAAQSLLAKNQTETQVLQFLEKELCARLGALNGTCVSLLETEGRQILNDLINGVNVSTVCKKFNLCGVPKKVVQKENPIFCTVCQYAVQFLDTELKGNKTEAAIVSALEKVCKLAPESMRTQCDNIVDTYGVYLVQLLVEFADPLKVCQAIKLC